ncbi:hypothetical protein P7V44_21710 [Providencia sp. CRE-3FA-0001]|uniref:Uncharacterized protein n=1 Tax=Providencia huashanensis TaxID=3037798 RepID=A0AA42FLP5_9GAMM|nr:MULTISPECIES: hypothetical protein [unclassified Providencia]MDG4698844.1 hypothetical protein [Providencia sp. CRE-3FA-0001]
MNDDNKKAVVFTGLIINTLYSGLIFMLLWNWFVVPLGGVRINFLWAIGLLSLITISFNPKLDSLSKDKELDLSKGFAIRTLALFLGFLSSFAV